MDRNARSRLLFQAEAYERKTKGKGQRSGSLGLSGLAVLRCIALRFLNLAKGSAWPSYDALQAATGFCRQTIADAIKRLEKAGFLLVVRRAGFIGRKLVKLTNLYRLPEDPPALPVWESLFDRRKPEIQESYTPWHLWDDADPLKKALKALGDRIGASVHGL